MLGLLNGGIKRHSFLVFVTKIKLVKCRYQEHPVHHSGQLGKVISEPM